MKQPLDSTGDIHTRILLHSERSLYGNIHFRLGLFEFEDIIRQVDQVDLISPEPTPWFPYGTRLAQRLAATFPVFVNPGVKKIEVQKNYDLFLAVVQFSRDLLHIKCVKGWRERCKTAICWLSEIWIPYITSSRNLLGILREFDYVVTTCAGSVKLLQELIGKPCLYAPHGIDAMLFCPYPNAPQRVIDVYSIGRRSEETHRTLLRMDKENKIFYIYDTISGSRVFNPHEHRFLYANTSKRSKYFIVNPGKSDVLEETAGQIEFGSRFFEGAASGTIMIGETPENEKFLEVFDWKDAVIHLPFGSDKIDKIINELDMQPERQEKIRRNNVLQSLRRHDWVYRWEAILKIAGLQPTAELLERKQRLENLAIMAENAPMVS